MLDPFSGTGTTLVAARDMERNAVGFDLNNKYISKAKGRLGKKKTKSMQKLICDDALHLPAYLDRATVVRVSA